MGRFGKTIVLLLVVLAGSWILYHRQQIGSPADLIGLARNDLASLRVPVFQASSPVITRSDAYFRKLPNTIRIATFKLNGETGAAQQPDANRLMTAICLQFDLIALQDVNSRNPEWLGNLVRSLEAASGRKYEFVASPFVDGKQFVTLFDSKTIQLDQSHSYTVNDPDDLYTREPFVCWFRAKQVNQEQAFTFSLASIQVEQDQLDTELRHLGNLYRAIREDGRGEDDIILVGDFQCGDNSLALVEEQTGLKSMLVDLPTNTMRTAQFDNIIFSPIATVESAGNAGVFDFMQKYNLFLSDALQISEHLPVWADFSIYEGTPAGHVAKSTSDDNSKTRMD